MRTGTVLYLADAANAPADLEPEEWLPGLGLDPRWTEVSGAAPGWPSPQDSALRLARRGAGRIEFLGARLGADGGVRRLAGGRRAEARR